MKRRPEPSPVMLEALAAMKAARALVRFPGGRWAPEGEPIGRDGLPTRIWGTTTINALHLRGLGVYTAHRKARAGGEFPIRMEPAP